MTIERRLREALQEVDRFEPSPDLFARVGASVEEDRAHRRRVRAGVAIATTSVALVALFLVSMVTRSSTGTLMIPRWAMQLVETVVLVAITLVLGPAIRRFGKIYASDVFRLDRSTGGRFLRLLDIAFYLVFFGMILMTPTLTELGSTGSFRNQMAAAADRLGTLLLTMGVLHAVTLLVLPVIGLVFSSTVRRAKRLAAGGVPPATRGAEAAERVARFIIWGAVAAPILAVLLVLFLAVLGLSGA